MTTPTPVATNGDVPTYQWADLPDATRDLLLTQGVKKNRGVWLLGVPMEDYLRIPALSSSGMRKIDRSPRHFREDQDNPRPPTPLMKEGSALHMAVFEPDLFKETYVVLGQCEAVKKGDGKRCTNAGVHYKDGSSYCGVRGHCPGPPEDGVEGVPEEWMTRFEGMKQALLSHPEASQYFRGKRYYEMVGIWREPETGAQCKIRLDAELERAPLHFDLKVTDDASEEAFYWIAKKFGYFEKSAFYRRVKDELGRPAEGSVLVAIERDRPHGVMAYTLDEDDLLAYAPRIDRAIQTYAACVESGEWPGYPTGVHHLKLRPFHRPDWTPEGVDDLEPEPADEPEEELVGAAVGDAVGDDGQMEF